VALYRAANHHLLGGLLPRPPPDGLPVVLGPLAGVFLLMVKFLRWFVCLYPQRDEPIKPLEPLLE
jgi:hypothetical protein